jgi:hypothetical protein
MLSEWRKYFWANKWNLTFERDISIRFKWGFDIATKFFKGY